MDGSGTKWLINENNDLLILARQANLRLLSLLGESESGAGQMSKLTFSLLPLSPPHQHIFISGENTATSTQREWVRDEMRCILRPNLL